MAYRRGSTRDDAIRVEEPQRNGDNQSTTRRPVVRRLVRPSNSIPADANVITLSDDEDGNQDQHHRPAEDDDEELQVAETSTAWTAAQNRRRSDHQALGDAGVPACAECTSTKVSVISPSPRETLLMDTASLWAYCTSWKLERTISEWGSNSIFSSF